MGHNADVTQLLRDWSSGDQAAGERLLPLVYRELKAISRSALGRHRASVTLQATELVSEAYLKLADQRHVQWQDRNHFFAIAATVVRRVLLDAARRRLAARRDRRLELSLDATTEEQAATMSLDRALELLDLDTALAALAELDARQARLVELRYFAGLSIPDCAAILDISEATAKRDWFAARAWLYRYLKAAEQ